MNTAKTAAQRVERLRKRRADAGQKRRELYATDAEWEQVQKLIREIRAQQVMPEYNSQHGDVSKR